MKPAEKPAKKSYAWIGYLLLIFLVATALLMFTGYNMVKKSKWVEKRVELWLQENLHPEARLRYTPIRGSLFGDVRFDSVFFDYPGVVRVGAKDLEVGFSLRSIWSGEPRVNSFGASRADVYLYGEKKPPQEDASPFDIHDFLNGLNAPFHPDSVLTHMPALKLKEVLLKNGSFEMQQPPFKINNIRLQANADLAPGKAKVELHNAAAKLSGRNLDLQTLSFKLDGDSNTFRLSGLDLQSNLLQLQAEATLLGGDRPQLDFTAQKIEADESALYRTLKIGSGYNGMVTGSLAIAGDPQNFDLVLKAHGAWAGYSARELQLQAAYDNNTIHVKRLKIDSPVSVLYANGSYSGAKRLAGRLEFAKFNLAAIDTSLGASLLNGTLNVDLNTRDFLHPNGRASLVMQNSRYDMLEADSLRLVLRGNPTNLQIITPSFVKFNNQARFNLSGNLSGGKTIDLRVLTERGDLHNLMLAMSLDSIAGSYYADLKLQGAVKNPDLSGNFRITDFSYDEVFLDSMMLDVNVQQLAGSNRSGRAEFDITRGTAYGIPLRDTQLRATIKSDTIDVERAAIYSNDNFIETELRLALLQDEIAIAMHKLRLEYEQYWLNSDSTFYVHIYDSTVDVPRFVLHGPENAQLVLKGVYDKVNQDARAEARLRRVRLEPFRQFFGPDHPAEGELTGFAQLDSIVSGPAISFNLSGKELKYKGVDLGVFSAELDYRNRKISIRDLFMRHDSARISLKGDLNLNLERKGAQLLDIISQTQTDLTLNWNNIELARYTPLLKLSRALGGRLDGYLEVEGTVNDPFMRQSLKAVDFSYDRYEVDSLVMFSQYSGGYLILDSLSTIFNGTSISAKGWQQLDLALEEPDTVLWDNPFELALYSSDDNLNFIGLFNEQLEYVRGLHTIDLQLSGTLARPAISRGKLSLRDGRILLSRVRDPIKNFNMDASIDNNRLTLNAFSGQSQKKRDWLEKGFDFLRNLWGKLFNLKNEEGMLYADGTIDLDNILRPRVDLNVRMNEFYVDYFLENTKLLLSTSNLRIHGRDTIMVEGRIRVPQGNYEVILDESAKNVYLSETTVEKERPPYIGVNLNLQIPGNFVVASSALDFQNNFKIILSGDLQFVMPPKAQNSQITGLLQTESGKFTTLNQSFNIVNGTIDFNDPNRINPQLDILAQKTQRDKTFELQISGDLDNIRQSIVIKDGSGQEMTMSEQDKIALLTLGTDISGLQSNADSTLRGIGEDVASNTLLTAVERGAESLTGLDKIEINSSEKLLNLQKLKLNNGLSQASVAFGKYLTSDLYVEYRTQFGGSVPTPKLSWDAGNRIALEYRINRFWSLDSYYEKTVPLGNDKVQLGVSWQYDF